MSTPDVQIKKDVVFPSETLYRKENLEMKTLGFFLMSHGCGLNKFPEQV